MKKKITFIILLVLFTSKIFAGEYIYWVDHKTSYSGKTTVHLKICYPKEYNDKTAANEDLHHIMYDIYLIDNDSGFSVTWNVTQVNLSNGILYRIELCNFPDGPSAVRVYKGNTRMSNGTPMEMIYEFGGFYRYNYIYDIYQTQCNKYLNML